MWSQILVVTDATMGVNYGLNKVRFPAPVPVGSRIRLTATLVDIEEVKGGAAAARGGRRDRAGGLGQAGLRARVADPALRLRARG